MINDKNIVNDKRGGGTGGVGGDEAVDEVGDGGLEEALGDHRHSRKTTLYEKL